MPSLASNFQAQRQRIQSGDLSRRMKERYEAVKSTFAQRKGSAEAQAARHPAPDATPTAHKVNPQPHPAGTHTSTPSPPASPAGTVPKSSTRPSGSSPPAHLASNRRHGDPDELIRSTVQFTEGHNIMLKRREGEKTLYDLKKPEDFPPHFAKPGASLADCIKSRYEQLEKAAQERYSWATKGLDAAPAKKEHMAAAEGQPSDKVSAEKAKEILRHGEVHGKPLSQAQKGLFGAAAGHAK